MTLEEAMRKDFENFMKDQLTKAYIKGYERAQSERKSGEWIKSYFNECCGTNENHELVYRKAPCVKCDQCGEKRRIAYNFCPNCGADMRPKDGEEE